MKSIRCLLGFHKWIAHDWFGVLTERHYFKCDRCGKVQPV